MKNDEKKCPLTKMTCYGEECAWWRLGECAVMDAALELYGIRRALEEQL